MSQIAHSPRCGARAKLPVATSTRHFAPTPFSMKQDVYVCSISIQEAPVPVFPPFSQAKRAEVHRQPIECASNDLFLSDLKGELLPRCGASGWLRPIPVATATRSTSAKRHTFRRKKWSVLQNWKVRAPTRQKSREFRLAPFYSIVGSHTSNELLFQRRMSRQSSLLTLLVALVCFTGRVGAGGKASKGVCDSLKSHHSPP